LCPATGAELAQDQVETNKYAPNLVLVGCVSRNDDSSIDDNCRYFDAFAEIGTSFSGPCNMPQHDIGLTSESKIATVIGIDTVKSRHKSLVFEHKGN